jgi:Ca2+-binding RTX toxin-like protein
MRDSKEFENVRAHALERLEPRRLMSAPVPFVQNGILKIWGTPGDDTIEVVFFGSPPGGTNPQNYYGVYMDGTTTLVPDMHIMGIHVHAEKGNDVVKLFNIDPNLISPPSVTGPQYNSSSVTIPETVFGGQGDDLIDAGYANPHVQAGTGPCLIGGGPGDDTISGNFGEIYAGQGNDSVTAGINTTVFAGRGEDTINTGIYSHDVITGISGNDTIIGIDTVGTIQPG